MVNEYRPPQEEAEPEGEGLLVKRLRESQKQRAWTRFRWWLGGGLTVLVGVGLINVPIDAAALQILGGAMILGGAIVFTLAPFSSLWGKRSG